MSKAIQKFMLLWLLICCQWLQAQPDLNILTSNKNDQIYQTPALAQLPHNWWTQAVKAAPQETPYLLLKNWSEELLQQVQTNSDDISAEDKQAIRQFRLNIQNLAQNNEIKETQAPVNHNLKAQHRLNEVLEVMQQLRQLNQQLEEEQSTLQALQDDVSFERQKIDQLIIQYQQTEVQSVARKKIAYQWLESRSWVAVYETQVNQFNQKIVHTDLQINQLNSHLISMQAVLQPNPDDLDSLEKQININQAALNELQKQALDSGLESNNNESLSSHVVDFEKLKLAESLMAQKRLELAIARDQLHKHWIANHVETDIELTKTSEELATEAQSLLTETTERIQQWRSLAQDVLLASVVGSNSSSEVTKQKTTFAQEVLAKLDGLDWQVEKVTFINSLVSDYIAFPDGGGFIQRLSELASTVSSGFNAVVNKPLFRINETPVTLLPLLRLIIIVLIGYLVSKLVRIIIKRVESRRSNDKSPVFFMLDKLIHYIIIFVAALAGFTTLGIDFSNLTLIAGALSVGIGFGLQNIVSNFVSGLTIMFERTLKVGDYIEIEDGFTGTVKEINARSTRINTNDNIDVVIPNSDLVTNQIINWTLRDSIKRVKIPFGVAYGTDKDLVKKAAQEAAENVPYTLANMNGKEPEVWMTGFGDNSLDFVLLVWVSKYGVRRPNRIKAAYLWELDTAFNKYGIEIPFPQRVLHQAKDSADLDDGLDKGE